MTKLGDVVEDARNEVLLFLVSCSGEWSNDAQLHQELLGLRRSQIQMVSKADAGRIPLFTSAHHVWKGAPQPLVRRKGGGEGGGVALTQC